ncbi:hypothetical protein M0802_000559 [Mischocyttarus mexicanus]|nr:hypothetical protein M0802_000559 [Mischocyttarus mexicanus]
MSPLLHLLRRFDTGTVRVQDIACRMEESKCAASVSEFLKGSYHRHYFVMSISSSSSSSTSTSGSYSSTVFTLCHFFHKTLVLLSCGIPIRSPFYPLNYGVNLSRSIQTGITSSLE